MGLKVVHIGLGLALLARELIMAVQNLMKAFLIMGSGDADTDGKRLYLTLLSEAFMLLFLSGWPGVSRNSMLLMRQGHAKSWWQTAEYNDVRLRAIQGKFERQSTYVVYSIDHTNIEKFKYSVQA